MANDTRFQSTEILTAVELREIEIHKYYLSEQAGYDVGDQYATQDWLEHHAPRWRRSRLKHELSAQCEEILKHKWIESEKAGRDLGQKAIVDWIDRYGAIWRHWRETAEDPD